MTENTHFSLKNGRLSVLIEELLAYLLIRIVLLEIMRIDFYNDSLGKKVQLLMTQFVSFLFCAGRTGTCHQIIQFSYSYVFGRLVICKVRPNKNNDILDVEFVFVGLTKNVERFFFSTFLVIATVI